MSQAPEKYPGDREDWDWDLPEHIVHVEKSLKDIQLWKNILEQAKTNPALQETLNRAILIYHMSKRDGQE